jgi:hypothetical protein
MKVKVPTRTNRLLSQWSAEMIFIRRAAVLLLLLAALVVYVQSQVRLCTLLNELTKRVLYTLSLT